MRYVRDPVECVGAPATEAIGRLPALLEFTAFGARTAWERDCASGFGMSWMERGMCASLRATGHGITVGEGRHRRPWRAPFSWGELPLPANGAACR